MPRGPKGERRHADVCPLNSRSRGPKLLLHGNNPRECELQLISWPASES